MSITSLHFKMEALDEEEPPEHKEQQIRWYLL